MEDYSTKQARRLKLEDRIWRLKLKKRSFGPILRGKTLQTLTTNSTNSFFQNEPKTFSHTFGLFHWQVFDNLKLNNLAKKKARRYKLEDRIWRINFKARTLKKNGFIFGFSRGAQVGEASFWEVNLRRKRRRWAYHFYLVCFRPWDPTKTRFWEKRKHF